MENERELEENDAKEHKKSNFYWKSDKIKSYTFFSSITILFRVLLKLQVSGPIIQ